MENLEPNNLSLPQEQAEAQTSNELSAEELETVAGGGILNDLKEGVRDAAQGVADGLSGGNSGESNLNYLGGNIVGGAVDSIGGALKK